MKKVKSLVYILLTLCLFYVSDVYAETGECESFKNKDGLLTKVELHNKEKTEYAPGDKVYVDIKGKERDSSITLSVSLKQINKDHANSTTLIAINDVEGNDNDTGKAYFIIPENAMIGDEFEIDHYTYYKTDVVDDVQVRYCAFYVVDSSIKLGKDDEYIKDSNFKLKVVEKSTESDNNNGEVVVDNKEENNQENNNNDKTDENDNKEEINNEETNEKKNDTKSYVFYVVCGALLFILVIALLIFRRKMKNKYDYVSDYKE